MPEDRLPQKHDNQHTTPPTTPEEAQRRIADALRVQSKPRKGSLDWKALFAEWLVSEDVSIAAFAKRKGIHPMTFQRRGGRTFWIEAKASVKTTALASAVQAAPDVWAGRFEAIGGTMEQADRLTKKLLANIEAIADEPKPEDPEKVKEWREQKRLLGNSLHTLAESISILNDSLLNLKNGGVQKQQVVSQSMNLHAMVLDSVKERDARFGIND